MWCREIEGGTGFSFDVFVVMELGAVVGGECLDLSDLAKDEPNDSPVELCRGAGAELSDDDVLRLSLDHGGDTVMVVGTDDGVDFPMPDSRAIHGAWWALGDVTFPGKDPTGIVGSIAFATLLESLSEVGVELAAADAVVPDVAINSFVADVEDSVQAQPAGDLLWAPVEAQQRDDHLQVPVGEAPVSPGVGASAARSADGLARSVTSVNALIAPDFSRNRRAVAPELLGDGALGESLQAQRGDHIPLCRGDLAISHSIVPFLGG